jgi:hypothetical protein
LDTYQALSKTALLALSDQTKLSTLEVHRAFFDVLTYHRESTRNYIPEERGIPILRAGRFAALNWGALFPTLQNLSILSPNNNPIVYEYLGATSPSNVLNDECGPTFKLALEHFPSHLTKLHLVMGSIAEWSIVDVMKLLPTTISDLFIELDGPLSNSDHYLEAAIRFPLLRRLKLHFQHQTTSPVFNPAKEAEMAALPLEEVALSGFHTVRLAMVSQCFPRNLPHLHSLSLRIDNNTIRLSSINPVPIGDHWPSLRTLKLLEISQSERSRTDPCMISSLPSTLTHFEVSASKARFFASNFAVLRVLTPLPFLTTLVETLGGSNESADPLPWELLPKTITRLEMQGFGLVEHRIDTTRQEPILEASAHLYEPFKDTDLLIHMSLAPPGLKYLKCPITSLRYLIALRSLNPDCYIEDEWYHRPKAPLDLLSWQKLEQFGCFDDSCIITDESITDFLATQLGPRTKISLSMGPHSSTSYLNRHELVHTFRLSGLPVSKLGLSIDFATASPFMIQSYPRLTYLDIGTRLEIQPSLLPNSLTSLHLRYSAISTGIISRCFEIESLKSLRAHGKVGNIDLSGKKAKKWVIFDVPQLIVAVKRLPFLFSETLEEIALSVFSVPDHELERLIGQASSNAKIHLSCSLLVTGKLADDACKEMTYHTLIDSAFRAFLPKGVNITEITLKGLWLPDGLTALKFDNSELTGTVNIRNELIARLPISLKTLELRNTGFEISWRKLSSLLPAGLERFLCYPANEMHDLESIAPLKYLKELRLEWPITEGASLTPLAFDISTMESLTHLELVNLQITYPLRDVTQALSNLRIVRIPKIDDCDIHRVFHGHPNIESVQVDTLNLSGACLPDEKSLDWVIFVEGSLSVVLPIVTYKRIMLGHPLSFAQPSVEKISFHHTSSNAFVESKPEIAEQIFSADFVIFQSGFPPSLTHLDFSSGSKLAISWAKCLSVLSLAPNLQWAKLDMPIDITVEASYPLLPKQLATLNLPLAYSSKKGGSGLLLPASLTELSAPNLILNPSTHPFPPVQRLELANLEYVKRMLSYAAASSTSNQKERRR